MLALDHDLTISIRNISFSYNDVGKGDIPVLFLHGFPFDKSMWKPQMDVLKDTHRVIALDLRSYGKTGNDNSELSINLFADDLIHFMDALKLNKAFICGLSMGGYVALNAVYRFPERFTGVVLCDTQCIADSTEGKEKRHNTIQQIKAGGLVDFTEGFLKNVFCKNSLINQKDLVESIRKVILKTQPETIIGTLLALANRTETCSTLKKISVPTLIICGKEDVVTPLAQSEFMQSKIQYSLLKIIDNAGHLSNLEQPEEFNQHLNTFLSSLVAL